MGVQLKVCPHCGNGTKFYIARQMKIVAVEDSMKPLAAPHPGAGTTHPAYELSQTFGNMYICRECGISFWELPNG